MENDQVNVIVIGGGVVGLAIAREIAIQHPGKKIVVLEKLADVGLETSGRNSGVLHTGFHQDPSFLKSKLARKGSKMAVTYHIVNILPILNCGMMIAIPKSATSDGLWGEFGNLFHLLKNGWRQDIKFQFLTSRGVRRLEPNINALGGIFIPSVSVIDSKKFVQSLRKDAEELGVEFHFNSPVEKVHRLDKEKLYRITTPNAEFFAKTVINSAGLYADDVARLAGFNQYKIYPWRGEYYEVIGEKRKLVHRLIYPAVSKTSPGKGIHFSPRIDGRLFLGPNAMPVPSKDYYEEDKTPVEPFLKSAQKFCPEIKEEDLKWACSGIRPKLTNVAEESDFIINVDSRLPTWINLVGVESPGFSASLAIGRYVTDLI